MEMNQETVKALLDAFDRSDWQEMVLSIGGDRLHVSRDPLPAGVAAPPPATPPAEAPPAAPAPPSAAEAPASPAAPAPNPSPAPPAAAAPAPNGAVAAEAVGTPVASPSVGLFWRGPAPGAPPFVEVGARVSSGDTIGIVEVMKLMNHVGAPVDGVVTAIAVGNGDTVEFGQTLVVVDPEA
jgi:acetyl-CoA carboxylase biotin carboxyl carrier protein